jgi:hypothetical protein
LTSTLKHTLALITPLSTADPMSLQFMKDPFSATFDDLIEEMCNDPMFIQQCEANNRNWDEEAAAELEVTVDELHRMIHPGHA